MLSVQPGFRGSNDLRVGRKVATFQLFFFSVQGTGGSPTGSDPEKHAVKTSEIRMYIVAPNKRALMYNYLYHNWMPKFWFLSRDLECLFWSLVLRLALDLT
jgi:hypothetical protein